MNRILLSLLAFAVIGAATPVSVSYVNPGTPAVQDTDSWDLVGPYTLNVNGQSLAAMCVDDYYNTSGAWTANVTAVTSADLSNTYLGNGNVTIGGLHLSSATIYLAEAYLFSQITKPGADRIDLQDAAWTLMDYATGHNPHSTSNQAVTSILENLPGSIGSFNASGYEILSQVNHGSNAEQEFIYATPEPASIALLGAALLFFGTARLWSRRSKQRNNLN